MHHKEIFLCRYINSRSILITIIIIAQCSMHKKKFEIIVHRKMLTLITSSSSK